MKLFEQLCNGVIKRRPKVAKIWRRLKHKAERQASKLHPEDHVSSYKKYKGYEA